METRRNIYDPRNSLKSPRPGARNLRRRQEKFQERLLLPRKDREYKTMPMEEKLVAHSVCVWCSNEEDHTFVICPRCHACQYCGLVGQDPNNCLICGNTATQDMIRPEPARKRALVGVGRSRREKRPVSRRRPKTRQRGPRLLS